jgi:hypothetical protein
MSRGRNYCITDFELDREFWTGFFKAKNLKYVYAGEEVCPTTGKKHWQMFLCFKSARTLRSVINMLKPRHVELMRGSLEQNSAYCSKEGTPAFELGCKPAQGARADLAALADEIKLGKRSVRAITEEEPMAYHQYGRTLQRLEDIANSRRVRAWRTAGLWLHGPTGTGKSHLAFEGYDPATHFVFPVRDKGWWDGYDGQEVVIINDFRGEIPYAEMLQLVDKWPHTVPRRCRAPAPFLAKKVIVTSSQSPEEVYNLRGS